MFMQSAKAFLAAEAIAATALRPAAPLGAVCLRPDHRSGRRAGLGALGADTLVETVDGWRPAAELGAGMRVQTRDGGLRRLQGVAQYLRWPLAGARMLRVPGGALGNCAPLSLTPEARVLIASPAAEEVLGRPEVLIPAAALDGLRGIRSETQHAPEPMVTLSFADDEIVWLNSGLQLLCGRGQGYWHSLDLDRARDLLALDAAAHDEVRLAA